MVFYSRVEVVVLTVTNINKTMKNELAKIRNLIYEIRGYNVMLESDLALLYQI
jgi:hypothetical protein